jgi:hypothetical protein
MCHGSDDERIGPMLASFERRSHLKRIEHEDAAERARQKGRDDEADDHERMARVHGRRAEMAEAGYLLHSKDEATDADHMRGDAELVSVAHRTGRVRFEHD